MAVSFNKYAYKLLNRWGEVMEAPIYLYNQIAGAGIYASLSSPGLGVYVQPNRERIAEACKNAVDRTLPLLRFYYQPMYVYERIFWNGRTPLITKYKHVQSIGQRATTLLEDDAVIVYSDSDSDLTLDLATITITVPAGTAPSEIKTYFRAADGAVGVANPLWEIEPTTVTVAGTTATITAHRALFVIPSVWRMPYREPNYNSSSINEGDTANAADFVTLVDVYREYPDPTQAAVLVGYNSNAYVTFDIVNSRLGLLEPSPICQAMVCDYRGVVDLWYYAGYPLDGYTGQPDYTLMSAMIRLSNAMNPVQPCNFDDEVSRRWQEDRKMYEPLDVRNTDILNNPFGVMVGQVEAWNAMKNYAVPSEGRRRGR